MFLLDYLPTKPTSPAVEEKLQSLEYRANCVSQTLKLYEEKIKALETRVSELEKLVSKGGDV